MIDMKITFENNFDFEKTYSEYGFNVKPYGLDKLDACVSNFECLFCGITGIHFLHNCMVIQTMNLGTDNEYLTAIKEKLGALRVGVTVFTPYIKNETNSIGLVYNIFFDENCCPIKYPKK